MNLNFDKNPMGDISDGSDRAILKEDHDNMPFEHYAGLGYPTHRYADYIPVADDQDQQALRTSIKQIGLLDPITLFEGAILDGRHRYKACQAVGVEPVFRDFEGTEEDALQFVLAKNIARRQLTIGQKLTLLQKLTPELQRLREVAATHTGGAGKTVDPGSKVDTAQAMADLVDVGRATAQRFKKLEDYATKDEAIADALSEVLADKRSVKSASRLLSERLERDAVAAKPNPMRQRAALASAIGKARALLENWDYSVLESDWEVADDLEALLGWVEGALDHAR